MEGFFVSDIVTDFVFCYFTYFLNVQFKVFKRPVNYIKLNVRAAALTLLSTSLQSIWDWTMYMSESTNPVHSLSFLLASLRSELTFL